MQCPKGKGQEIAIGSRDGEFERVGSV